MVARAELLSGKASLLPGGGGKAQDSSGAGMSQEQKLGCESQSCAPGLFGMIWERAAAAGLGGTAPALWVGKIFLLSFHFLTEFHPSQRCCCLGVPLEQLLYPFTPNPSPLGVLSKEESIPQHTEIPLHIPAPAPRTGGSSHQ